MKNPNEVLIPTRLTVSERRKNPYSYKELLPLIKKGQELNKSSEKEVLFLGQNLETGEPIFSCIDDFMNGQIIGHTGSGKSCTLVDFVLLNHLMLNEKAKWYFADGKAGGDFDVLNILSSLPSVEGRSPKENTFEELIDNLWSEFQYRNILFRQANEEGKKVNNIFQYRDIIGSLPRIFIVIDEFRAFFGDSEEFEKELNIPSSKAEKFKAILVEGRTRGFTFILSSQRLYYDYLPTIISAHLPTKFIHQTDYVTKGILNVDFPDLEKGNYVLKPFGDRQPNCTMPFLGNYKDIDKFIYESDIKNVPKDTTK